MVENKLLLLTLSFLVEKHAYSLIHVKGTEGKQLLLNFSNVNNVDELLELCNENSISLGKGELINFVSDTINQLRKPTYGMLKMQGIWSSEDFFIGEILRIYLRNQGYIEIIKVDCNRWWVTTVKEENLDYLTAQFVSLSNTIGTDTQLEINSEIVEVESVDFIIATDTFRAIDKVLYPSSYRTAIQEDLNIEETLIIPLFDELKKGKGELKFRLWREILLASFQKGLDYKTVWFVTNSIATHLNRMYQWN